MLLRGMSTFQAVISLSDFSVGMEEAGLDDHREREKDRGVAIKGAGSRNEWVKRGVHLERTRGLLLNCLEEDSMERELL
jgi:hypothetical protein